MALLLGATDFLTTPANQPGPISMWVRTTIGTQNTELAGDHNAASSTAGWSFLLNNAAANNGIPSLSIKSSGGAQLALIHGSGSIRDGNWHHIGLNLWYAGGVNNQLFVDGALQGQADAGAAWGSNAQPTRFGDSNDTFWASGNVEFAEISSWGGGGALAYLTPDQWAALAKGAPPEAVCLRELRMRIPLVRSIRDYVGYHGAPSLSGGSFTDHPRLIGARA